MATVSIIIPTYNHQDCVLETLGSVFAQTYQDFEVIVINDGSPDETARLLLPLAESGRIRYVEQVNQGQAAARNAGFALARGEFVAFLDDDDLWLPGKLEWQVQALQGDPEAVLVYGHAEFFGSRTQPSFPGEEAPSGRVKEAFIKGNWMWSPGQCLMRREALAGVGGFDESVWGADDWDLYIRMAEAGSFIYRNLPALSYRLHDKNSSRNFMRMYRSICGVRRKHLKVGKRLVQFLTGKNDWVSWFRGQLFEFTDRLIGQGSGAEAVNVLLKGLVFDPSLLFRRSFIRRVAVAVRLLCRQAIPAGLQA